MLHTHRLSISHEVFSLPALQYPLQESPTYLYKPNSSLTASPNLSIAVVIFSGVAAANVALKNSSFGTKFSRSALNQLPLLTKTPLSTAARKTLSSNSGIENGLVVVWEGWRVWSSFNHSCDVLVCELRVREENIQTSRPWVDPKSLPL